MRDFSGGFKQQLWDLVLYSATELAEGLEKICGSPIETDMAVALCMCVDLARNEPMKVVLSANKETAPHFYIRPQAQIGRHRVDFVVGVSWGLIEAVIECDGREFHHSTREQIERDRARDAELEAAGYKVFRFPGTQIHNTPIDCAGDVWNWVLQQQNGFQPS